MHISNLVLHGFKSFGKKTSMSFGRGITGLVGPNGCGKTNIVDALRWVLGEQKMSVLRSTRMEEIIFNGSKNRKPSSLCEVILTIHNDKSKLPAEYTDIEISRRLYRDGESEYLINRTPCRRRDLLDLFVDTGMGSDAYSVIELKMIEAILSETGEDRRRMFEEAAGINKYKSQRASTQRKLEATHQDLERVHDIITEVDGQVHALGLQLKRFKRHKTLGSDLKHKEIALAGFHIGALARKIKPLQDSLRTGRDSHKAEAAAITGDEQQLATFQASLDCKEQDLEAARQSFSGATAQLNEIKQQQLVREEQLRSTRQSRERFEQEQKAETERRKSYTDDLIGLEEQLKILGPQLETMQSALEAKRGEESAVTENYRAGEQQIQAAREQKFTHQHRMQEEEARRGRAGFEGRIAAQIEAGELDVAFQTAQQAKALAVGRTLTVPPDSRPQPLSEAELIASKLMSTGAGGENLISQKELFIEYFYGPTRAWAFYVFAPGDNFEPLRVVELDRAQFADHCTAAIESVKKGEPLAEIGDWLLAGRDGTALSTLWDRLGEVKKPEPLFRRVVISPDGPLCYVPLHDAAGAAFAAVTYLPTAAVLKSADFIAARDVRLMWDQHRSSYSEQLPKVSRRGAEQVITLWPGQTMPIILRDLAH